MLEANRASDGWPALSLCGDFQIAALRLVDENNKMEDERLDMRIHQLGRHNFGRAKCFLAIALTVCWLALPGLGAAATGEEPIDPPNSAAIFEQARTSERGVVFAQDFEGPVAENYMSIWYVGSGSPCRMVSEGATEEQAFSGKRSYKVQVEFQPGNGPAPDLLNPVPNETAEKRTP